MAVQLKLGYDFSDFIGIYKSPANTALSAGLFVKLADAETIGVASGAATDDGAFILIQEVTLDGPTYQEIVNRVTQHDVKAGSPVTVVPVKRGAIIKTSAIATGTDTGAITNDTPFGTEVGISNGKLRVAQSGDVKKGKIVAPLNGGFIDVELY